MEENKKLKIELEKGNSSSKKPKSEGLFSRILNTVDSVSSGGFRPVRDIKQVKQQILFKHCVLLL